MARYTHLSKISQVVITPIESSVTWLSRTTGQPRITHLKKYVIVVNNTIVRTDFEVY